MILLVFGFVDIFYVDNSDPASTYLHCFSLDLVSSRCTTLTPNTSANNRGMKSSQPFFWWYLLICGSVQSLFNLNMSACTRVVSQPIS